MRIVAKTRGGGQDAGAGGGWHQTRGARGQAFQRDLMPRVGKEDVFSGKMWRETGARGGKFGRRGNKSERMLRGGFGEHRAGGEFEIGLAHGGAGDVELIADACRADGDGAGAAVVVGITTELMTRSPPVMVVKAMPPFAVAPTFSSNSPPAMVVALAVPPL
jgi:hypothetical protein